MEHDGMRYLDKEMSPSEREEFEKHVNECEVCRKSLEDLGMLNELTSGVLIGDPMDTFWEGYWKSIYRRIERKTAWIFVLVGGILLVLYEIYRSIRNFGEITFEKIVAIILITGMVMLLVSVVRERIHQRKTDKYKDIIR